MRSYDNQARFPRTVADNRRKNRHSFKRHRRSILDGSFNRFVSTRQSIRVKIFFWTKFLADCEFFRVFCRFKKPKEREPLCEAMKIVLPILYERMVHLLTDQSQESTYLQKMILKIFYVLVQVNLKKKMNKKIVFIFYFSLRFRFR